MLEAVGAEPTMTQSPEERERLIHELHVHQIELELQNNELRRIQEDLEISRARYFDLYDLAPVSYVTLNTEGVIQEVNFTAATLLGLPRSALLQRSLTIFIFPEDQDIYYRYRRDLDPAGRLLGCELRMLRPDKALFWVRLETIIVPGASGSAATTRMVLSDITTRVAAEVAVRELNATLERRVDERTAELQASEERLRRMNLDLERALRLKDEFLAMMSHELRTPLSIVLSLAEALNEDLYGPLTAAQRRALVTISQSGRHLLALLSDILDLARIAVEKDSLDRAPVDIAIICQMALLMVEDAAQAKDLQISRLIAPGLVGLRADERRLMQILVNLLSNAVKFTPAGGSVALEVTANVPRDHIQFSVWDSGIGIAAEDQERIFEPFIQADARLARQYGGVGLGLALVRRLVELHGGSIRLVSVPNQGSRFIVSLPWSAAENSAPAVVAAPEVAALPIWVTPPRVVLADDHEPSRNLYTDLLTSYGYEVLTARTGEEVLALVDAHQPDVVILDIQMPGMGGLEAIRRIRKNPASAGVPILVLTALAMLGEHERCMAAGANVYLTKPANLHSLLATLGGLLPQPPG